MAKETVSATMKKAIKAMQEYDGKLIRLPGGFWQVSEKATFYFGTTTVEALVSRGLAEYTVWKEGGNGKFPIEVSLAASRPQEKPE